MKDDFVASALRSVFGSNKKGRKKKTSTYRTGPLPTPRNKHNRQLPTPRKVGLNLSQLSNNSFSNGSSNGSGKSSRSLPTQRGRFSNNPINLSSLSNFKINYNLNGLEKDIKNIVISMNPQNKHKIVHNNLRIRYSNTQSEIKHILEGFRKKTIPPQQKLDKKKLLKKRFKNLKELVDRDKNLTS